MKKLHLLGAVCACLLASYLPSTSYASLVLNPGPQPGGDVIPLLEAPGTTELDVVFFSMQPIFIDFDSLGIPTELLVINNIFNNTGTPWTGIDFTFFNSAVLTPIGIIPETGIINGVFFDGGPTFIPGVTTSVSISFDPAFPEYIGLINGQGDIDTFGGGYTLAITPSAVPVPAAVWLFGSGLLGLIAIARRKKAA